MALPLTETLREVTITTTVFIRKFTHDDGTVRYDWVSDNDDSDEWFDTADGAEYDARTRLGD